MRGQNDNMDNFLSDGLLAQKREDLVDEYILPLVSDEKVIEAMKKIPRHKFVPRDMKDYTYEDTALRIGYDQTVSQPSLVALMTEMLQIKNSDKVLEVGTGSGYQTAILAELAKRVVTIERIEELSDRAKKTLNGLGYVNIKFIVADGSEGCEQESPYDAIMITAAAVEIPKRLTEQLKVGGRMVIPIGKRWGRQHVYEVTKNEEGKIEKEKGPAVQFVPLVLDEW